MLSCEYMIPILQMETLGLRSVKTWDQVSLGMQVGEAEGASSVFPVWLCPHTPALVFMVTCTSAGISPDTSPLEGKMFVP